MVISVELQLEALKLLQDWSIWIITITTVFLGMIGFAFKNPNSKKARFAAKYCIVFLLLSLVVAVMLVGAIPAIVQKLHIVTEDNIILFKANARGIYGYYYLDFIPLWLLASSQRILFLLGLGFGARLVWLQGDKQ